MSQDPNPTAAAADNSGLRIGDEDRQDALQKLRAATSDGLLTLDEFGERTAKVLTATTQAELTPLVGDITPAPSTGSAERDKSGIIIGVFGGGDRRGRWRLPQRCIVINVFGGGDLDLRGATVAAAESKMTVVSLFGGSDIYVPPGIEVDAGGVAIFGGNDTDLGGLDPAPGAPVVRIRAYSLFGGTDVRVRLGG